MNLHKQELLLLDKLIKSNDKPEQEAIKRTIIKINEEMEEVEE